MKEYLKKHRAIIHVLSPIHIGDGALIKKNEYIHSPKNKTVYIPDIKQLYEYLYSIGFDEQFNRHMISKNDLGKWLLNNNFKYSEYKDYIKYNIYVGDVEICNGGRIGGFKGHDIISFNKDSYGFAYVPGSSIKGMIRTALLAYIIESNKVKYKDEISRIIVGLENHQGNKRNKYMDREIRKLENRIFNTLDKTEKIEDALNSIMAGLIISDSKPIDTKNIILTQKVDYGNNGINRLNILRESLKPGTKIEFDITIDEKVFNYDLKYIKEALKYFNEVSNKYFYSKFKRSNNGNDIVYLGGGVGIASKIVLYSLLKDKNVEYIQKVFKYTLNEKNYNEHKHNKDHLLGVSPHMCKCTYYNGKLYNMGIGRIEFI